MMRFISLLLLILGIGAIWIGGQSFLDKSEREARLRAESMEASAPMTESVEMAEMDSDMADVAMPEPYMAETAESAEAYADAVVEEPIEELPPVAEAMEEAAPPAAAPDKPEMARRARSIMPQMAPADEMGDTTNEASVGDALDDAFASVEESMSPGFSEMAPMAAPPPPAKSAAQQFIDSLISVPIAHETPSSAEYKRAFNVTLAIDATGEEDNSAADALPGTGNVVEGTARVSDRVEVRLIGASFDIIDKSPAIQSLSPVNENTWRWSVTPLTAGSHDLVFEVYAVDQDNVVPLRTFTDKVTVEVSGINQIVAFADQANPMFVLLGGVGSALGGLFGAFSFFKRRK